MILARTKKKRAYKTINCVNGIESKTPTLVTKNQMEKLLDQNQMNHQSIKIQFQTLFFCMPFSFWRQQHKTKLTYGVQPMMTFIPCFFRFVFLFIAQFKDYFRTLTLRNGVIFVFHMWCYEYMNLSKKLYMNKIKYILIFI